jgi:hypothetical protein
MLSRWYLARLIRPRRWRRHVLPKRRLTLNALRGVISPNLRDFQSNEYCSGRRYSQTSKNNSDSYNFVANNFQFDVPELVLRLLAIPLIFCDTRNAERS